MDLGFLDDSQLWELMDEAKSTGLRIGEAAVNRGLITGRSKTLSAIAEQLGLPIVNLAEKSNRHRKRLQIVPETMASAYTRCYRSVSRTKC